MAGRLQRVFGVEIDTCARCNRWHPQIAKELVDHNDYPREALIEALLRFVEEDLDRQAAR